jgi:HAD superfamily hydrolase (TIGR01509 family)
MGAPYQGVIFDLDGTLIDSEKIAERAMVETFKMLGLSLADTDLAYMLGRSSRVLIPEFLSSRNVIDPKIHQSTREKYLEYYDATWHSEVKLMPHAHAVLNELYDHKIRLGIATTSRTMIVERFLEKYRFQNLFYAFVSGDMIKRFKPDPEIYCLAVERLDMHASYVLAVEDSCVGAESADAAGVHCAVVHSLEQELPHADYVFPTLEGILQLF